VFLFSIITGKRLQLWSSNFLNRRISWHHICPVTAPCSEASRDICSVYHNFLYCFRFPVLSSETSCSQWCVPGGRLCWRQSTVVNPLESRGNDNSTSNNMKLVHWPLMGGLLHLVQRGKDWAGPQPARPVLAVPNVTAHPSTAGVPITVLLYNGPLLSSR